MWVPAPDPQRARAWHADGSWGDDTIADHVARAAAAGPDRLAVVDNRGARATYGELDVTAARVAGWLAAKGVGRGDIVTVCLPNWVDTIAVFLGILKLGAIINPVPVTYGQADLAFVAGKCRSKALVVTDRFRSANYLDYVRGIVPGLDRAPAILVCASGAFDVGTGWQAMMETPPLETGPRPCGADEPAAVLFTSGTESKPKGAVHTHNTILFGERSMAAILGVTAEDVAFMASPVSHATGFLHGFVMTLMQGGTLSLLDIFKPEGAIAQLRDHKAMWTMGATPFLADISRALAAEGGRLPDLKYFLCGGAPVPEQVVKQAAESDIRVLSVYGSTESPPHTVVRPEDPLANAWTSDGRAVPGVEIRIVDQDGRDVEGEADGEEWSRGPNTFVGYLDEPELTAKALDGDGWVHSGDLARWRPDGSIRIVGRIKELIIRGGQNISVREVEEYLLQMPGIRQVAVVGIPHERLGETGCAVVVTDGAADIALGDVQKHLIGAGVAKFKIPERVEMWEELPMTPSGKIQKYIIRQKILASGSPE